MISKQQWVFPVINSDEASRTEMLIHKQRKDCQFHFAGSVWMELKVVNGLTPVQASLIKQLSRKVLGCFQTGQVLIIVVMESSFKSRCPPMLIHTDEKQVSVLQFLRIYIRTAEHDA